MANLTIPLGYKYTFEPSDYDLLVYLSLKLNGQPLPCERAIREIDLYGLSDPGKLFQGTDEKAVYVFTKLKKVSKNGKRVERSVTGNRTWKGVDGGKPIYDSKGCKIGEKKSFSLINKIKTLMGYNMNEFTLDNYKKDLVLCQIKKKVKKPRKIDKCSNSSVSVDNLSQSQEISNVNDQALVGSGFFEPSVEGFEINEEVNSWMENEGFGQNHGGGGGEVQESSEIVGSSWDMVNYLASTPNWSVSMDDIFGASSALPIGH